MLNKQLLFVLIVIVTALGVMQFCKPDPQQPPTTLLRPFGNVRHCPVSALEHSCFQEFFLQDHSSCGTILVIGPDVEPFIPHGAVEQITTIEDIADSGIYGCIVISDEFWKCPDTGLLLDTFVHHLTPQGVLYIHHDPEESPHYVLQIKARGMHTLLSNHGFETIYIGKHTYLATKYT